MEEAFELEVLRHRLRAVKLPCCRMASHALGWEMAPEMSPLLPGLPECWQFLEGEQMALLSQSDGSRVRGFLVRSAHGSGDQAAAQALLLLLASGHSQGSLPSMDSTVPWQFCSNRLPNICPQFLFLPWDVGGQGKGSNSFQPARNSCGLCNSHSSQQPWTTPDNPQHQEFCHRFPKCVNVSW